MTKRMDFARLSTRFDESRMNGSGEVLVILRLKILYQRLAPLYDGDKAIQESIFTARPAGLWATHTPGG